MKREELRPRHTPTAFHNLCARLAARRSTIAGPSWGTTYAGPHGAVFQSTQEFAMGLQNQVVTASVLAGLFGVSETQVRELGKNGAIPKVGRNQYDLVESIRGYCRKLREVASGRGTAEAVLNLSAERARLAKEQADQYSLKNANLRGELVDARQVEVRWADEYRRYRSAMLAVPSRVRHRLPHLTRDDADEIDAEVRLALTEAAEIGGGEDGVGSDH